MHNENQFKVTVKVNTDQIPNKKHTYVKPKPVLYEILAEYDSVPFQVSKQALNEFLEMLEIFVEKKIYPK